MHTTLLVDSDNERGQVVAAGICSEWKVCVVGSVAEALAVLETDDSVRRVICSYRISPSETAATLHVMISDWLQTMCVDMTIMVWEEDELDPLEQLYFSFHGVELVLTWEDVDHALVAAVAADQGVVS